MTPTTQPPTLLPPAQPTSRPKANPNALLILFRKYHTWFGLFTAVFVVMIAATGIYLNHKDAFQGLVGPARRSAVGTGGKAGLPATADLAALPISLAQAVDLARQHWDGQPVEKVELKPDHGRLAYKVKAVDGREVVIDAHAGTAEVKGGKKPRPAVPGKDEGAEASAPAGPAAAARRMDWGKAIKDLHTGKIAGDAGKLLVDLVAVLLIVLTGTGVYLWIIPILRKRRSARQRGTAAIPAAG